MSLLDTLKGLVGKGKEVAAQNAEKIEQAVDKAGAVIDEKTKGKYSSHIDKGKDAVKNAIPADTAEAAPAEAPAEPAPAEPAPTEAAAAPAPEPAPAPAAEPAPDDKPTA
ncbi:antitoxin [Nocardia inohanensis]|uniref:antitoxin n=1 Tax=Nocardia inohanensis TaxID=209246 RepID=UPI000A04893A|nr:antitoxin [Nocardia inohanensis]